MNETYYIWWNIRRALQRYLYTHLVYGHPGDEPRSLKDKDGGDGDGAADAEHLQTGQDLWAKYILVHSPNANSEKRIQTQIKGSVFGFLEDGRELNYNPHLTNRKK